MAKDQTFSVFFSSHPSLIQNGNGPQEKAVVHWAWHFKWPVQGYMGSEQTHRGIWANATDANYIFIFYGDKCLFIKITFCLFCIRVHSVQSLMEEDLLSPAPQAGEVVPRRRLSWGVESGRSDLTAGAFLLGLNRLLRLFAIACCLRSPTGKLCDC